MTNQTISDYYTNLQYDEFNETEAITKLSDLSVYPFCQTFSEPDSFSSRLIKAADIINKNLPLFQSFCEHVDIVTAIIEYLRTYGIKFMLRNEKREEKLILISTLLDICVESNVRLFLSKILLEIPDLESFEKKIYDQALPQYNEAIIFEDSDFHLVIKALKKHDFNVIWIQEALAAKFFPSISKSLHQFIRIFRSKQELLDSTVSNVRSITSIWSEDIIAAKDLAASLNRNVIFINTFMDMCGGIVSFPHIKKLNEGFILLQNKPVNTIIPDASTQVLYNLFYDGMWQKPVKNTYWLNEDHLLANATNDDIKKCLDAAKKGAKIWDAISIDSRIIILSKLADILKHNNKCELAQVISKWILISHFYENSINLCSQNGRLEITVKHKPSGIVALKGKDLDSLFYQLTIALMAGNSTIVLCNSVNYSLAPYCDMFSTAGIPPGVINMLSIENVENVLQNYYINEYDLKSQDNPYTMLTEAKIIVLPVK